MSRKKIPVVILTAEGPRHSYFCRELAAHFEVKGIVVDVRYGFWHRLQMFLVSNQFNPFRMVRNFILKNKLRPYQERDERIEKKFFPAAENDYPAGIPVKKSSDLHDAETRAWIKSHAPEVIAVFGTRLIKNSVLELAGRGALNIHTGLSPYYRGGQCTFWCLYREDLDHLGVTIHHLSPKIDGGDILYTAQPFLEAGDTVRSIECKLVKQGTEKMIQAIEALSQGHAPRIPQTEKGQLFLSKMFTLEKRLELERKLDSGWLDRELAKKKSEKTETAVPL